MSRKNILVLIEQFGQGGAEKAAAIVSQMIHEDGRHRVVFCSVYQPSGDYHSNDVEQRTLGIAHARSLPQKLLNYYRKLRRLRRLKKELRIDLTISSLWPADWINYLSGRDKKVAVIQINILNNAQNAAMVRLRGLVSRVYNGFDRVVLVSANLREEMTGFFGVDEKKIAVIHNPIDARQLEKNLAEPLPAELQGPMERYRLLIAANRLHEIKNTAMLAPVFKALPNRDHLKLVLVGAGGEEAHIKAAVEHEGLRHTDAGPSFDESADVYFLGFRSNIHHYVSRASVFLLPTKGEGFPLALLEAMYCRVPILASDCPNGGVFEIMEGEGQYDATTPRTEPQPTPCGYLMPIPMAEEPRSVSVWADRINTLLSAPADELETIRTHNRAHALAFDQQALAKKWFQLIDPLLYEK